MPYRPVDTFRNSDMNRKTPARKILRVTLGQPLGPTPPEQFNVSGRKKSSAIMRVLFLTIIVHIVIACGAYLNYKLNNEAAPTVAKQQTPPPSNTSNTMLTEEKNATPTGPDASTIAANITQSNKADSLDILPDGNKISTTIAPSPTATVEVADTPHITSTPSSDITNTPSTVALVKDAEEVVGVDVEESVGEGAGEGEEEEELVAIELPDPPTQTSTTTQTTTPTAQTTTTAPSKYLLVSGDSWEKVAKKFNLTVTELQKANPVAMKKPQIYAGSYLNIPSSSATSTASTPSQTGAALATGSYTIKSGDNLSNIAKKYNMKLQTLLDLNNLKIEDARSIRPGQILKVQQ